MLEISKRSVAYTRVLLHQDRKRLQSVWLVGIGKNASIGPIESSCSIELQFRPLDVRLKIVLLLELLLRFGRRLRITRILIPAVHDADRAAPLLQCRILGVRKRGRAQHIAIEAILHQRHRPHHRNGRVLRAFDDVVERVDVSKTRTRNAIFDVLIPVVMQRYIQPSAIRGRSGRTGGMSDERDLLLRPVFITGKFAP